MKVIDTRERWLGTMIGDEAIRLTHAERVTLRRASAILEKVRELRAEEYHRRGMAETLGLAADVADEFDNYVLAGADAYLGEFLESIYPHGDVVLPECFAVPK